jgi:hypothetical protein
VYHRGCSYPYEYGWVKSYNGSKWESTWTGLGGCVASGLGAEGWAPDWKDVFYRGCDSPSNVYKAYYNGSGWPYPHGSVDGWP